MSDFVEQARDRLRSRIEEQNVTVADLAKEIGRSADYIRDFLGGRKNSMGARDVAAIERALKLPLGHLFDAEALPSENQFGGEGQDLFTFKRSVETENSPKLAVWAAHDEQNGFWTVSTDPINIVPRPWFMGTVVTGFAVVIPNNEMAPAFHAGDLAVINDRLPFLANRDVLLVSSGKERGLFKATLRRLISWTSAHWTVEQLRPPADRQAVETLTRDEWTKALRVVAVVHDY